MAGNSPTFDGLTLVEAGQVLVNGSQPASSGRVNGRGILGGTGTIGPIHVTSSGCVAPGVAGPGRLTCGGLSTETAAGFRVDLNGAWEGLKCDQLAVHGTVLLTITVALSAGVGRFLFCAVYAGAFNPGNVREHLVADSGRATFSFYTNSFSFNAAPRERFVLVVHERTLGQGGRYMLQISGGRWHPWLCSEQAADRKTVVSWSTAAVGYRLEWTDCVSPSCAQPWYPVSSDPPAWNGTYRFTNNTVAGTRFYRLRK